MQQKPIPILMYHSIAAMPKGTVMRSLHVPPKLFRLQMWLLKILGYKGLSMNELQPYLTGDKQGKVVGITFDDGFKNNLTYALPILKKFEFSATCYIISQNIGGINYWDLDKGIPENPLMNENEIITEEEFFYRPALGEFAPSPNNGKYEILEDGTPYYDKFGRNFMRTIHVLRIEGIDVEKLGNIY